MIDLTAHSNLLSSLACAALNPGLRSILVFDAPYDGLQQLANLLEQLLAQTEKNVQHYNVSPIAIDDELWGNFSLPGSEPVAHLFSPERNRHEFQLLTIADLSSVSVSMARTCIMLIGADVVHIERNAESYIWHPRQCWLASCPDDMVGAISPHLLDRFALRLSWYDINPALHYPRREQLKQHLATDTREGNEIRPILTPDYLKRLQQATKRQAMVMEEAIERVLDYMDISLNISSTSQMQDMHVWQQDQHAYYPRREVALARIAYTLAQWQGDAMVTAHHVDEVASWLNLSIQSNGAESQMQDIDMYDQSIKIQEPSSPVQEKPFAQDREVASTTSTTQMQSVQLPDTTFTESVATGSICHVPYREDGVPIEREAASLKLPISSYAQSRSMRGPILGTEKSFTLHDLAIVSTILAAARFQKLRGSLRIEPTDLRRYRRGNITEHLLMLLLDYTCVHNKDDWQNMLDALVPYLHTAYVQRAAITIIQVGVSDDDQYSQYNDYSELRARVVSEKSILVPRVSMALEAERGRATPLAHGIHLALEQLQRTLQHGRTAVSGATFIVVTDGRGNVPLLQSQHRDYSQTQVVTTEGISDALTEAYKVAALKRVTTIVFSPKLKYYAHLPLQLAQTLKAIYKSIPLSGTIRIDKEVQV